MMCILPDLQYAMWVTMVLWAVAIILPLTALFSLRNRVIEEMLRFLWAVLILVVPILGSLVYFIVQPGELEEVREGE